MQKKKQKKQYLALIKIVASWFFCKLFIRQKNLKQLAFPSKQFYKTDNFIMNIVINY